MELKAAQTFANGMNATSDPFKRLAKSRVDDALFARAYDAVREEDKSAFKRCIAAHYADSPPAPADRLERTGHRGGFSVSRLARQADVVVVLLPPTAVSPLKLLAALMPARTGAGATAVVRNDDCVWEDGVLTALELAGQEDVFAPQPSALDRFFADAAKAGLSCVVLDLARGESGFTVPQTVRVWSAPAASSLAVFCEEGSTFDLSMLVRLHPDSRCIAWNPPRKTRGVTGRTGGLLEMLDSCPDAAYVPAERLDIALDLTPLSFGPGGEALWFWPTLCASFFQFVHIGCTEGE